MPGIVIVDAGDRVAYCSADAAAIRGRSPEGLIGAPLSGWIEGLPPAGEDGIARVLRGDGRWVPARARIEEWTSGGRSFCTIFLNATSDDEAARDRDDARRMRSLGRVAAAMAHEFNNVLAGIGSFAEYLNRRAADDGTRNAAMHIGTAVRRGKSITDEILGYTRAKPPALAVLDVHAWLQGFLPEANAITGGRTRLDDGARLFIRGDAAQLNLVLINLLTNARDASAPETPIVLRATTVMREESEMLDLAVIDRGTGIAPEIRDQLFEPLFTTKRSATGLGLPLVDQVVRAHGGVVRLRTEVGKGSEFHVLLPLLPVKPL